jgi:hypothetical protein
VRWVFADIVPDYLCGQNTAVLFLSLRCVWQISKGQQQEALAALHMPLGCWDCFPFKCSLCCVSAVTAGSASKPKRKVLLQMRSCTWCQRSVLGCICGDNFPPPPPAPYPYRYHLLQPEYVLSRLQALQRGYRLCVLLLLVDAEEVVKPLLELHRATLGAQAVLVCAWSNEVCLYLPYKLCACAIWLETVP